MSNIFEDAVMVLNKLGKQASIDPRVLGYISKPEQLLEVNFPVSMDDGTIRVFNGYRCRYSTVLGVAKGGIRFHHEVSADEVKSLALWMAVKNSLAGLPYGGGKGGVIVDVKKHSLSELEAVARGYVRAIVDNIGENIDVPAPDVGTNAHVMSWMIDEYENIKRKKSPGAFTGKPVALGGSLFRTEATGFGAHTVIKLLAKKLSKEPSSLTIAIQGLGNVGYYLAKFLYKAGFKVVALSDIEGGIYMENGINIDDLFLKMKQYKEFTSVSSAKLVSTLAGVKAITNKELLELGVEILVPAAIENVINDSNAHFIKARYIVEAANGPLHGNANDILEKKGILIVPDVLANSGGVVVSYFEWLQNISCYYWDEEEVKERLTKIMTKTFNNVWDLMEQKKISMRSAAYAISLERLQESIKIKYNMR